jgi:hypothetical protein
MKKLLVEILIEMAINRADPYKEKRKGEET